MRTRFDEKLTQMNNSLLEMGVLIETAINRAVKALLEQDATSALDIIQSDKDIDEAEKNIESQCLKLILHQQPIAGDLRSITTALKMITDMERIGDHATDISEITVSLSHEPYVSKLEHIPLMAKEATRMVTDAINAYVEKDLQAAKDVIAYDDVVDDLFSLVRDDLVRQILDDSAQGRRFIDFLMVAKYLERVADHAVNIAEWVIFCITGEYRRMKIL